MAVAQAAGEQDFRLIRGMKAMLRAVTMRPSRKGGFMSMTIICTLTRSFSSSSFTFVRRTTPLCSKRFSSHITLSWFCCACARSVSSGQHQQRRQCDPALQQQVAPGAHSASSLAAPSAWRRPPSLSC